MVIRTQPHHNAVAKTMKDMLRNVCDEQGTMLQQPAKIDVHVTKETKGETTWSIYNLTFAPMLNGGKEMLESFKEYVSGLDEEANAKFVEWVSCDDSPVTDEIRDYMSKAAKI